MPTHRVTTSTGSLVEEPDPRTLARLVAEVARGGDGAFLILERCADSSGQSYVQTLHQEDEWLVEARAGSAESHYRAVTSDPGAVTAVLAAWCGGAGDWHAPLRWEHVPKRSWWQRRSAASRLGGALGQ